MKLFIKIIVCFIAGAGAGIGTGFAGMSAAAVISPMLITFLNVPAYQAVGIGLASDVLASAISALTYRKNKNINVKSGLVMMLFVLIFTMVGSLAASYIPETTLDDIPVIVTMIMGLRFIIKPVMTTKESMEAIPKKTRIIRSVLGGLIIGLICGFVGAGGGMMMLIVLTSFLGYELKTAVGTSVFVMAFTALTGSVSHFALDGVEDVTVLLLCIVFTFIWARIAAVIANKAKTKTLNIVTGIILIALGLTVLTVEYIWPLLVR